MTSPARAALLVALRDARRFEVPEPDLHDCLTAEPTLLDDPGRLAVAEGLVRGMLLDGAAISPAARASVSPVLGNIAEAVIEVVLADYGWTPVYDDDGASSFGHGVDLLMLDPAMERMVAIEVKSTVQAGRWPRLASGRREQLTPAWFDRAGNEGMAEWGLTSSDVCVMVVQVHLRRRLWRACLARGLGSPQPVAEVEQLADLEWVDG